MSESRIPLAGVIGAPIHHSRSPRLHGHWLRRYGIAGHYIPMEIAAEDLREALAMLPRLGFVGANVTIPHKERVMELADDISERARLVGAANTLTFQKDGRLHADNTDGYGFIQNLRQNASDWVAGSGPAVVLGAGGAARGVILSLLDAGVPEIRLANRTQARADALAEMFGPRVTVIGWEDTGHALADAASLVNTTSLGMVGQPELDLPLDALQPRTLVTDIVYTPLQTRLLHIAAERGCSCVDGLGMLLHQAVPGFERWFGRRPEVDEATRAAVLS